MKYRCLHKEELEEVQDEFIRFLAANSITKNDWDNLKSHEPEKVDKMIEVFSDIFWDKVLENLCWAQIREAKSFKVFQITDKWEMVHLKISNDSPYDLTQSDHISAIGGGAIDISALGLEVFTGEKPLIKDKKTELFEMLEGGGLPCSKAMWLGWKAMVEKSDKTGATSF